jgi:hypothetical protein
MNKGAVAERPSSRAKAPRDSPAPSSAKQQQKKPRFETFGQLCDT